MYSYDYFFSFQICTSTHSPMYRNDGFTNHYVSNTSLPGSGDIAHKFDGHGVVYGLCGLRGQPENDS